AGLGEHALLTRRQAPVLLAPPQVPDHLRHLVDVTRGELLQVGLVAPRPIRRLLGMRCPQYLEDFVEPLLVDHVTNAHVLGVGRRYPNRQITLRDAEHQVLLVLALDLPHLDRFDQRRAMMGVNNGVSDTEIHVCDSPFNVPIITRRPPGPSLSSQVRGAEYAWRTPSP